MVTLKEWEVSIGMGLLNNFITEKSVLLLGKCLAYLFEHSPRMFVFGYPRKPFIIPTK